MVSGHVAFVGLAVSTTSLKGFWIPSDVYS